MNYQSVVGGETVRREGGKERYERIITDHRHPHPLFRSSVLSCGGRTDGRTDWEKGASGWPWPVLPRGGFFREVDE